MPVFNINGCKSNYSYSNYGITVLLLPVWQIYHQIFIVDLCESDFSIICFLAMMEITVLHSV